MNHPALAQCLGNHCRATHLRSLFDEQQKFNAADHLQEISWHSPTTGRLIYHITYVLASSTLRHCICLFLQFELRWEARVLCAPQFLIGKSSPPMSQMHRESELIKTAIFFTRTTTAGTLLPNILHRSPGRVLDIGGGSHSYLYTLSFICVRLSCHFDSLVPLPCIYAPLLVSHAVFLPALLVQPTPSVTCLPES